MAVGQVDGWETDWFTGNTGGGDALYLSAIDMMG